ncbi:MAG: hypothetical protein D6714_08530, partial [Bacteroidetes bacterium]
MLLGTFLVLWSGCLARAQAPIEKGYRLLTEIKGASKLVELDKLNQIYVLTPDNELVKYDSKGQEVFR